MSDFEYLSVLVAIIVGIGVAHLLLSIGRIVGETKSLNVSSVQLLWTANVLMLLVAFWWWAIALRELEEWVFLQLLFLIFDVSLWCLLAAILFPITIPVNYDLSGHFERKRISFFSILILLAFTDPVTSSILGTEHLLELGWGYLHWILACLVAGVLGVFFRNKRLHQVIAIYWGMSLITFVLSWQYAVGAE